MPQVILSFTNHSLAQVTSPINSSISKYIPNTFVSFIVLLILIYLKYNAIYLLCILKTLTATR